MRARVRWSAADIKTKGFDIMGFAEVDKQYVAGTYKRFPVELVSGKGSLVYDIAGKEYIDMGSGIGVTSFGICDDVWQDAVKEQIAKIQHSSNLYYTEPCARLAEMLCKRTGFDKVFFSNSGAEANECAIKVARKYAAEKKGDGCFTIVTLKNSFHGRTLTTLAATGQEHYHELFQPLTPGFEHITAGNMNELEAVCESKNVAAVMIECIQGEGGVIALDEKYASELDTYVKEHDMLLIVDEVQTGNGRTGKLYSYMNYGLQPDIVSTAKGLAGGLPLGATMLSKKVSGVLSFGDHGSTFGGNPVSCAAAISILSRINDTLLDEVNKKSCMVKKALANANGIESVSGMGLMLGIKTQRPAVDVINKCIENGVLCLAAKDKVRLLPALNIPEDVLMRAVNVIKQVCAE